ncbi:hypothetical protein FB45DRAFT_910679 [Roridomyces roridus]|uniref:Uncharacterized protein n=1 Tax=Roridomyces roridus TaxID=1738132 RepID=A0AAD7FSJ6_9AGAR|nr:hypothetical protein FB45DRAFT_910679 [Roridomyces roridus]
MSSIFGTLGIDISGKLSDAEYTTLYRQADYYIKTIISTEQDHTLMADTVEEVEKFLAEFHDSEPSVKKWFYDLMQGQTASSKASRRLKDLWRTYKAKSRISAQERAQRGRQQPQAALTPPRSSVMPIPAPRHRSVQNFGPVPANVGHSSVHSSVSSGSNIFHFDPRQASVQSLQQMPVMPPQSSMARGPGAYNPPNLLPGVLGYDPAGQALTRGQGGYQVAPLAHPASHPQHAYHQQAHPNPHGHQQAQYAGGSAQPHNQAGPSNYNNPQGGPPQGGPAQFYIQPDSNPSSWNGYY